MTMRLHSPAMTAVAALGSVRAAAEQLGVSVQLVYMWLDGSRKPAPADCAEIERLTSGRSRCETLRPDVRWGRIPDPAWPWHPAGRPVVEVVKPTSPPPHAVLAFLETTGA